MGLEWDVVCVRSGGDHKIIHTKVSERQCYVGSREILKENHLVKVMSKPLEGDQVSTVPLNGKPDEKRGNYLCRWLPWRDVMSLGLRWNQILQKQDYCLKQTISVTMSNSFLLVS